MFFYGTDAAGMSTGAETLWIPYAGVAGVVLLLAVVFFFAPVPDIKTEDDYHIDDKDENQQVAAKVDRQVARVPVFFLLWFNTIVLLGVFGMILWLVLNAFNLGPRLLGIASQVPHPSAFLITADNALLVVLAAVGCVASIILAVVLIPVTAKMSHHSIWSHPHFSGATLAQFLYVAAQAGIFSFVINYMVWEVPPLPASWHADVTASRQGDGEWSGGRERDEDGVADRSQDETRQERNQGSRPHWSPNCNRGPTLYRLSSTASYPAIPSRQWRRMTAGRQITRCVSTWPGTWKTLSRETLAGPRKRSRRFTMKRDSAASTCRKVRDNCSRQDPERSRPPPVQPYAPRRCLSPGTSFPGRKLVLQ